MNMITANIKNRNKPNDVIFTPKPLAKVMIDFCDIQPTDLVLDPSRGGGVFYDNFPECNKDYCEITEDIDFFKYDKPVDIICGNPPWSLWNSWLEHTIKLNPKKFCYIFGQMNLTLPRLKLLEDSGYKMTKIHLCKVAFWFGHSFICIFEKTEKTEKDSVMSYSLIFNCDICGKPPRNCNRGITTTKNGIKTKHHPNICTNIKN